jgi:tRNA-dihydrouridine synthase
VSVTGSGDLYAPEDAEKMLRETGCAAVMFARGAMGNPFIFSASRSFLVNGTWQPEPVSRRLHAAFRQLELLAADIGERSACLEMRKQFCAYTKNPKMVSVTISDPPAKKVTDTILPGGAALRNKLVHAETIAEYKAILGEYIL